MASKSTSPNHRQAIYAYDPILQNVFEVQGTTANGAINVNASVTLSGSPIPISGATTALGVAILDGSGNQVTSFGAGTQYTDGAVPPAHPIGNTIEWSDGANWQTVSTAKPLPVTATFTPSGTQDTNVKQINGVTPLMGNGVTGTGSQRVTIASDNTAFTVLAAQSGAWSVTSFPQIYNGATFESMTGAGARGTDMNIKAINAVVPLMGNGVTGTGSLRVTIASDNTAFSVNATLSAETTKVIGTVRNADGAGNLWTSNSTTYTAKFGQDANLLGTLGTAFSTAGKVDIKGADGDVFVRQTTGSNLHTVLDSGTLTTLTTLTGTTTLTPGTGATNLGKAEDAGHTTGDTGVMALGVRQDSQSALAGTTLDYIPLTTDSVGSQYMTISASTGATGATMSFTAAQSSTKAAINTNAGNLYGYHLYNVTSATVYLQLFNLASASVTVGSTTPNMVIAVPAFGWADSPTTGPGIGFTTALTIAATTTATGSGNPGTGLMTNLWYK